LSSYQLYKNANLFIAAICVIFNWYFCKLLATGCVAFAQG